MDRTMAVEWVVWKDWNTSIKSQGHPLSEYMVSTFVVDFSCRECVFCYNDGAGCAG
jgi:hypothetical protein